jgi:fatty-acyl-CoA synthase
MFHVTGMQANMNNAILNGHSVSLMLRWDRAGAAAIITKERVTAWTCITTMAVDFLSQPGIEQVDLSSLQRIGGGGAPMPAAVAEKLKVLTGLDYIEGYGLTETAAPSHMNPVHRPKKQCAGVCAPDTDARVIDPETFEEKARGEQGEIVTHGPQVFKGYWNNPEATRQAFIELDGKRFFRTGDLGYVDEEGYFFITDRLKRMINAAGYKVWPAEVESMLYAHPAVQEACVIASLDARRGETVKAVIVKRADAANVTADEIIEWSRSKMAAYKVPRVVQFAASLPRSGTGKVLWRVLQDQERQGAASQ